MDTPAAGGFVDFARFAKLRETAHGDQAAALGQVADEFEALFVDLMLKAARQASPGDGLFDSQAGDTYQEMFDQQMAQSLAQNGDLGIARTLIRQFEGMVGTTAPARDAKDGQRTASDAAAGTAALRRYRGASPYASVPRRRGGDETTAAAGAAAQGGGATPADEDPRASFIAELGQHAERAGRALGVPPRAILAQAALETGWGRHAMRHADGRSANNYFGIKAGPDWHGDVVRVPTREYVNGRVMTVTADFRAYDDPASAFRDYVDFIGDNPRYREALARGGSESAYARELAAAGYATDPAYAEKIIAIIETGDWTMYPDSNAPIDPDQGS